MPCIFKKNIYVDSISTQSKDMTANFNSKSRTTGSLQQLAASWWFQKKKSPGQIGEDEAILTIILLMEEILHHQG